MRKNKSHYIYLLCLEFGTHRGSALVHQIDFEMWVKELSKEFTIYTNLTSAGVKEFYIINYWGEKQKIGFISKP